MEQKMDNLYPLCLFSNNRIRLSKKVSMDELLLFKEHYCNDAEIAKRWFTTLYPAPYICSECMQKLELCMGDKTNGYFRHSSNNIGCGGVWPIHKAFVASVARLWVIDTLDNGKLEFSQDSVKFEETVNKNRFDFTFKNSRFISRIGVEIDFTSKTTAHNSGIEYVYKIDVIDAFNKLSEKFWSPVDFEKIEVIMEVDRLSTEFLFSRVPKETEDAQLSMFSWMEPQQKIKIPTESIFISLWEKIFGRLSFYIKKIFYKKASHDNF